jgi:hypothetical protein
MARARIIVEPHGPLSCLDQRDSIPKSAARPKLLGKEPCEPLFCTVWQTDALAPAHQRQRSYEAAAATILETAFNRFCHASRRLRRSARREFF